MTDYQTETNGMICKPNRLTKWPTSTTFQSGRQVIDRVKLIKLSVGKCDEQNLFEEIRNIKWPINRFMTILV